MRGRDAWRKLRWFLALLGLCALATCPAAQRRCATRRQAREAPALLGYLVERVRAEVKSTGQLPAIEAGPTPAIGTCCESGDTCAPEPTRWDVPGWRALAFSIDGRHRFAYQVHRDGAALVLTAIGDQDCDGVRATYQVRLTLERGALREAWTEDKPLE